MPAEKRRAEDYLARLEFVQNADFGGLIEMEGAWFGIGERRSRHGDDVVKDRFGHEKADPSKSTIAESDPVEFDGPFRLIVCVKRGKDSFSGITAEIVPAVEDDTAHLGNPEDSRAKDVAINDA